MRYDLDADRRLDSWETSDPTLYEKTLTMLQNIADNPTEVGQAGDPLVDRLLSYGVPGRDAQYVIAWDTRGPDVVIVDVASEKEFSERALYNKRNS